jgi:L-fucose isomerase-like protein
VFDSLTDIRRAISQHLAANVSQHAEALADVRAFRYPMRDAWPSNS